MSLSEDVYNSTMDIGPQVMYNTVVVTASLNLSTDVSITYEYTWIDGTVIGKQKKRGDVMHAGYCYNYQYCMALKICVYTAYTIVCLQKL